MEFNLFYEMGYCWLEAELKDIFDLKIQDDITPQSRIEGRKVFLDMDFDARYFLERMRDRYPKIRFQIKHNKFGFEGISDKEKYTRDLAEFKFKTFF